MYFPQICDAMILEQNKKILINVFFLYFRFGELFCVETFSLQVKYYLLLFCGVDRIEFSVVILAYEACVETLMLFIRLITKI